MPYNSASIDSPEVIKEFRAELVKFEDSCRQAVFGVRSDLNRARQWLQHEQLHYWQEQLRRSDEVLVQARAQYTLARHGSDYFRKPSVVEEAKALRKAELRKAEAQQKIANIKKWVMQVEAEGEKLLGPVNQLNIALDSLVPKGLSRLDVMIRSLEDYLRDHPAEGPRPS